MYVQSNTIDCFINFWNLSWRQNTQDCEQNANDTAKIMCECVQNWLSKSDISEHSMLNFLTLSFILFLTLSRIKSGLKEVKEHVLLSIFVYTKWKEIVLMEHQNILDKKIERCPVEVMFVRLSQALWTTF